MGESSDKRSIIHFGSLEEQFAKESKLHLPKEPFKEPVPRADETLPTEASQPLTDAQLALLHDLELRKRARSLTVPTDDTEIKLALRRLGEPICLFGEGPAERRERLRDILARKGYDQSRKEEANRRDEAAAAVSKMHDSLSVSSDAASILGRLEGESVSKRSVEQDNANVTWYHEGSQALLEARLWLASHSVDKARQRLIGEREWLSLPAAQRQARRHELRTKLTAMGSSASQVGDSRPVASVAFSFADPSGNSRMLATAGWSGSVKLWSVPECSPLLAWRGHATPATCVAFHPDAIELPSSTGDMSDSTTGGVVAVASCAHDGTVRLWSVDSPEPLADLEGHAPYRVSRLAFHPSGRFLATCCFDASWRLWDLEVGEELLHQEGHTRAVYDIAFHPDGGLAASASLDCFARLWDLRTGRCVLFMDGHQRPVLGVDFSHDGLLIATASQDNTVRLWDLRQRRCSYTLPAHTGAISQVRFGSTSTDSKFAGSAGFLATASYDGTLRLWDSPSCAPLRTLAGHESRVTSVAIAPSAQLIASASFDRTFKLWTPQSS